jgi:hypothetical protein
MSFIGDRVFMLFPDDQVRLDETVDSINAEEIKEYMLSMARPLLHVVRLIEGIRMT